MKVYVVTAGAHSDHHCVGVYDDKETAETLASHLDCGGVEEYELNAHVQDVRAGCSPWEVRMTWDGGVTWAGKVHETPTCFITPAHQSHEMVAVVLAHDREHAVKITNEKRARSIAAGHWPAPDKVLRYHMRDI